MATRSRVVGVPKLRQKLRRLPAEARSGVQAAMLEGAEIIRDEAKRRVPVDTGALRDAIQVHKGSSRDGLSYYVGVKAPKVKRGQPKKKWPWYVRFVEFGVRAQRFGQKILRADLRRVGKGRKGQTQVVGKTLKTSRRTTRGQRAQPFLFPAFEAKKREVFARVQKAVDRAFEKVSRGG